MLNYKEAYNTLPPMGLDILEVYDKPQEVMGTLFFNDKVMVHIWHYFVKKELGDSTLEEELAILSPENMQQFKDALWSAVVNFMPSQGREMLRFLRKQFTEMCRSPEKSLESLSSSSLQEQE